MARGTWLNAMKFLTPTFPRNADERGRDSGLYFSPTSEWTRNNARAMTLDDVVVAQERSHG